MDDFVSEVFEEVAGQAASQRGCGAVADADAPPRLPHRPPTGQNHDDDPVAGLVAGEELPPVDVAGRLVGGIGWDRRGSGPDDLVETNGGVGAIGARWTAGLVGISVEVFVADMAIQLSAGGQDIHPAGPGGAAATAGRTAGIVGNVAGGEALSGALRRDHHLGGVGGHVGEEFLVILMTEGGDEADLGAKTWGLAMVCPGINIR